jgi:hypothetical protein
MMKHEISGYPYSQPQTPFGEMYMKKTAKVGVYPTIKHIKCIKQALHIEKLGCIMTGSHGSHVGVCLKQ